jgi:hypothetical protein
VFWAVAVTVDDAAAISIAAVACVLLVVRCLLTVSQFVLCRCNKAAQVSRQQ